MRKIVVIFAVAVALLSVAGILWAGSSEIDDDLTATHRLFPGIGPGLRAVRRGSNGNYYVLASPSVGLVIFDPQGKKISAMGAPQESPAANNAGHVPIAFGQDCDVDAQGNVYVADGGSNLVTEFSPDGKQLRAFPVNSLISLAALPDGEVAVTTLQQKHLVTVYSPDGKVSRQFGDEDAISTRSDLNHYLNLGRVASDPQGHIYYGFSYMPEPLVRQYDRYGNATLDFEFTGLDAFPEASGRRKAIEREESRSDPPTLAPILTAFGVDPINGDVWMGMNNTLVHFDKDGIRRSEYQVYTTNGTRLDATVILVEEQRLLIGEDPLGVYEFPRPDRKR